MHRLLDTDLDTDTAVCEAALVSIALCFTFLAASSASCLHLRSYRLLTGKKRGPKVPSLGPRSGLSPARPRKLMWSRTIIRSPTWQQVMRGHNMRSGGHCTLYLGLRPPTALLTTSIFTPSSFMILTGRVHIHSG